MKLKLPILIITIGVLLTLSFGINAQSIPTITIDKPIIEMTIPELQAKIAEILQAIQQLQALIAQMTPQGASDISGIPSSYTFNTNLTYGSSSNEVKYLQIILNQDPDTRVSTTGWGSSGNESTYFGNKTKQAIIKFQAKYKNDISTIVGYTIKGTGYLGQGTRTMINQLLGQYRLGDVSSPPVVPIVEIDDGSYCGDNIIQTPNFSGVHEVCDNTSLNNQTCSTRGYFSGALACSNTCLVFDTSSCLSVTGTTGGATGGTTPTTPTPPVVTQPVGPVCGDNTDNTCPSGCTYPEDTDCTYCGDNILQTPNDGGITEVCDNTSLNSHTCSTQGFPAGGTLACSNTCLTFNTGSCYPPVPPNNAPVLNSIGNQSTSENQEISFNISGTDTDNDTLAYSVQSIPSGATFTNQTFTWTPTYTQSGTYNVIFTLSDSSLTDTETITITVGNVNRAPTLDTIGDKSTNENQEITFTISGTDLDDSSLNYSIQNRPTGSSFNASTRTFTWTPTYTQSGTYSVTFIVSDTEYIDEETITITVSDVVQNYTLTVNTTNGSVSRSPNQAVYTSGTVVTLTAVPNSGYTFSNWSGDLTGVSSPATIIMDSNKIVSANFSVVAVVTVCGDGTCNGTETCSSCSVDCGVCPAGQTTSQIEQFGITWTFDKEYQYGQFVNGDYWVVGPVTITSITPDFDGSVNGWEVNPSSPSQQGFDSRPANSGFSASLIPSLPYTANPEESILKVSSHTSCSPSCIDSASVLTILSEAPNNGENLFRPPYFGSEKPFYSLSDLNLNLLPSLFYPSTTPPTISQYEDSIQGVQLDHIAMAEAGRYLHPIQSMPAYGTNIGMRNVEIAIRLMLDDPVNEKRDLTIRYIQHGIDLYHSALGGRRWSGNGGHGEGRKLPMTFAALLLNNQIMKDFVANSEFNQFGENDGIEYSEKTKKALYSQQEASAYWYWGKLTATTAGSNTYKDPYGYIDGSMHPGLEYLGNGNVGLWKGDVLAIHLFPELKPVWNKQEFLDFIDRYVNHGIWVQPDPCAPPTGVCKDTTNNPGADCTMAGVLDDCGVTVDINWASSIIGAKSLCDYSAKRESDYGVIYGPDSSNPGECILDTDSSDGIGRIPWLHGGYRDLATSYPLAAWIEELWDNYREEYGCIWQLDNPKDINSLPHYNCSSCTNGCLTSPYCGDGSCNGAENSSTCPYDCGATQCAGADISCGIYQSCQNCNSQDGCIGTTYRDYYCISNSSGCGYTEDDCSDCSCSCGGYNQTESIANNNCNDGIDNNCNGLTDSQESACQAPVVCTSGQTQPCSTGLQGVCSTGTETCQPDNTWGSCIQDNQPIAEDCTDLLDNDCDGSTDCSDTDCSAIPACQAIGIPLDYVSYWKFEGNTNDKTETNNGTIVGNPQYISGVQGQGLSFDGDGDYVNIAGSSKGIPKYQQAVTVSAWVKVEGTTGDDQTVVSYWRRDGNKYSWRLFYDGTNVNWQATGSSYNIYEVSSSINLSEWYHIVGVYNGGTDIKFYLDGSFVDNGTNAGFGSSGADDDHVQIGSSRYGVPPPENFFTGVIDEVMIYNRALSESEIQDIYNAQKPGASPIRRISQTDDLSNEKVSYFASILSSIRSAIQDIMEKIKDLF